MKNAAGFSVRKGPQRHHRAKKKRKRGQDDCDPGRKTSDAHTNPRETANAGEGEAEHAEKCPHAAEE
jgi:hypothetical protein